MLGQVAQPVSGQRIHLVHVVAHTGSTPISDAHSTLELVPPSVRRGTRHWRRWLHGLPAGGPEGFQVVHTHGARPLHGDALEILGAHDRPRPAATGLAVVLAVDQGKRQPGFAAPPMVTTMACGAFRAFFDGLVGRQRTLAPDGPGRPDGDGVVVNPQVDRFPARPVTMMPS